MTVLRLNTEGQKVGGDPIPKSLPLLQNSWNNPPTYWPMKLFIKVNNTIFGGQSTMAHTLVLECVSL